MNSRFIGLMFAVVAVGIVSFAIFAKEGQPLDTGKTQAAAQAPDFTGVWWSGRPENDGAPVAAAPIKKRSPLPLTPWAQDMYDYNKDPRPGGEGRGRIELDPRSHCVPPSTQFLMTYSDPFEIIQSSKRVLIMYEYDHWNRQIWINQQHPKDLDLSWMGNSVAKWQGDTLVVDTVGMHDNSWFDGAGHVRSTALHIVERFRRPMPNVLEVVTTFDDPKAFTKPWTQTKTYNLKPDWQIVERVFCEDQYLKTNIYDNIQQ